jgi:hypothetical protein
LQVFHTAPLFHTLVSASIAPLAAADLSMSDTEFELADGTIVRIVRDKQHGKIAYISVKLPRDEGQDPKAVVAGFEEAIESIEPRRWQRGRCAAALD